LQSHQQNVVVDAVERGAEVEQRKQRDALLVGGSEDAKRQRRNRVWVPGLLQLARYLVPKTGNAVKH